MVDAYDVQQLVLSWGAWAVPSGCVQKHTLWGEALQDMGGC
jgi:hypothetical protein